MKRNLMTILILALLVINVGLTAVIMFSTISANKKTVALVDNIATVLNLELDTGKDEEAAAEENAIAPEDIEVFDIEDSMTIALKPSADGSEHYSMVEVSFSVNKAHDDYATYQPMLAQRSSKIKSEIIDVIGGYTKEEAMADKAGMEEAILARVQAMFNSDFVYEAYFRDIKFQ